MSEEHCLMEDNQTPHSKLFPSLSQLSNDGGRDQLVGPTLPNSICESAKLQRPLIVEEVILQE